jgi:hypothetical protein
MLRSLIIGIATALALQSGDASARGHGGTARPAPPLQRDAAEAALTRDFPDQASEVVEGTGFVRSPRGFTARAPPATGQPAVEAAEEGLSLRGGLRLGLPARGDGPLTLSLPTGFAVEVRERGTHGRGRHVRAAVAYGRADGTSYWRTTDTGYEEWIVLADAHEGPVVEWEVQGGRLRQQGDTVVVADASGRTQLRVTAPRAYGPGGREARAWLRAEDDVLALYTTARGQALLDPLWTAVDSMGTERVGHTATLLSSGKVLVAGGYNGSLDNEGEIASAELYDPVTGTWSATGSLATARFGHTATLLTSGRVLVAGGSSQVGPGPFASAELYDPVTGTWSATGSLATAHVYHSATLLPSGRVLVAGGFGDSSVYLASAELYDPGTGTWSATGSLAAARERHTATLLPSGRVLVTGGGLFQLLASAELYDPVTGTWSATGSLATARFGHTATLLSSGRVLVTGGYSGSAYLASAELYDPDTGTWSATGSLATARIGHTATLLSSGRVLVAGGFGDPAGYLASAELYDPVTGTWSATGSRATARERHTATLLSSGRVLVAGGYGSVAGNDFVIRAEAEVFDPAFIVVIFPGAASVAPKATQFFTASGGSGTGYTWVFVTNASGASLSPSGTYVAGATGGVTDILEVTDSLQTPATVRVDVTGGVVVSPSSVTLTPKASQTFTASGGSGTGYTWAFVTNLSGSTLSASGVYTAGATGGVSDVIRVTDSLGNSATATVTVTGGLVVSPSSVTLTPKASQTFTASGGSGTGYTWAFVTNLSGSTLSASGVYTAGATGGVSDVIRVTDSLGNSATATVTVTAGSAPSNSGGCGTTGGDSFPLLALGVLALLTLRRWRYRGMAAHLWQSAPR